MFACLLVDLLIGVIILAGGIYGYLKGIVLLTLKPLRKIFRFGASMIFCMPASKLLIIPITANMGESILADLISVILSFFLIMTTSGWLLSVISGLVCGLFNIGILGKCNRIIGSVSTIIITVAVIWIFTLSFARINPDFIGGPVFRIIRSYNPFI